MPFAFTEQGVAMLSSVLKSDKAIDVNVSIMRAFVMLRQFSLSYEELAARLTKLEKKYNKQFKDAYEALDLLLKDYVRELATVEKIVQFPQSANVCPVGRAAFCGSRTGM